VASRRLRELRPEVRGHHRRGVLWSPAYFVASCRGAPLSIRSIPSQPKRKGRASSPS
jgi:putative transposase